MLNMDPRHQYDPEEKHNSTSMDSSEPLLDCEEAQRIHQKGRRRSSTFRKVAPWALHLVIFSIYSAMFFVAMRRKPSINTRACLEYLEEYSPAHEVMVDEPHTERFIAVSTEDSPYRGPPSPEVDAAWAEIIHLGAMQVSEDEWERLNASKHSVLVPEDLGGGRLALVEFAHLLHCVHSLWSTTWPEYYTEQTQLALDRPRQWHSHMDHCADILRQKFMCDVDVGMIAYNWIVNYKAPHPNFNVQHKCRNWDAALEWAKKRQVNATTLEGEYFLRPEDGQYTEFHLPPFDPLADEWPLKASG